MSKPIILYSHTGGPNPWKVAIILEELKLPYTSKFMEFPDLKKPPFEKLNPNGRVPAIEDPNTGIVLAESGAIIEYLQETYDKDNVLNYTSMQERYQVKQWIHFQMSGQGPYFGQAAWFLRFHHEQLKSAQDRYLNEIKRVVSVIDRHLEGKQYLVGDKVTIADLSFLTWNAAIGLLFDGYRPGELDIEKEYPNFYAWEQRLHARPAVKKVFEDKQAAMAASAH